MVGGLLQTVTDPLHHTTTFQYDTSSASERSFDSRRRSRTWSGRQRNRCAWSRRAVSYWNVVVDERIGHRL